MASPLHPFDAEIVLLPTVEAVQKVAEAVGVVFIAETRAGPGGRGCGPTIRSRTDAERLASSRERNMVETVKMASMELRFLHSPEDTNGSLTMFEMLLQPGGRMPVPHHHRDWEETIYGLSGRTWWTVDGGSAEVGPGDSLFIARGVVHGFTNATSEPATCLCVLTPGVLAPAYFHEMAALVEGGKPDPVKMKATMLRHGLVPKEG